MVNNSYLLRVAIVLTQEAVSHLLHNEMLEILKSNM